MATADFSPTAGALAGAGHDVPQLSIDRLIVLLALAVLMIALASFAGAMLLAGAGFDRHDTVVGNAQVSITTKFLLKFDLAGEQTVAAWLSSVLMLLCAGALFQITALGRRQDDPYTKHWVVLGAIFVALSIDEMVAFHEMTINPLRAAINGSGVFLYTWVVPGIAFVAVVGLAYLGFLVRQPSWFRNRCILAGALFVGGAVGFEMMEGGFAEFYSQHRMIHEIAVHVEDLLEFAGLLVFLHALLSYLRADFRMLRIRLE